MAFCAKRNNAYSAELRAFSVNSVSGVLALFADVRRDAGPSGRTQT